MNQLVISGSGRGTQLTGAARCIGDCDHAIAFTVNQVVFTDISSAPVRWRAVTLITLDCCCRSSSDGWEYRILTIILSLTYLTLISLRTYQPLLADGVPSYLLVSPGIAVWTSRYLEQKWEPCVYLVRELSSLLVSQSDRVDVPGHLLELYSLSSHVQRVGELSPLPWNTTTTW